jgi:hypothetical protein
MVPREWLALRGIILRNASTLGDSVDGALASMTLAKFFALNVYPAQALPRSYNDALVLLSYLVAVLGSDAFLQFATRIAELQWGRHETTGQLVRKDGTKFEAHIVLRPLSDASKRLVGFGLLAPDVVGSKANAATVPDTPAAKVVPFSRKRQNPGGRRQRGCPRRGRGAADQPRLQGHLGFDRRRGARCAAA